MIKRLKFLIPNKRGKFLANIIGRNIAEKYYWFIDENDDQVFNFNKDFLFKENLYDGNLFFQKISDDNCYIVSSKLQAYITDSNMYPIVSFDDFVKSDCQIIILITDNIFVDIFAKNNEVIDALELNAQLHSFEKISIETVLDNQTIFF